MKNCSQVSALSEHNMPRDSTWYFLRESDTNEWKVYKSDKLISAEDTWCFDHSTRLLIKVIQIF